MKYKLALLALLIATTAAAIDIGWRTETSIVNRYAVINEHLGVKFIGEHDGFGVHKSWWYCVTGRCYELPGEIL